MCVAGVGILVVRASFAPQLKDNFLSTSDCAPGAVGLHAEKAVVRFPVPNLDTGRVGDAFVACVESRRPQHCLEATPRLPVGAPSNYDVNEHMRQECPELDGLEVCSAAEVATKPTKKMTKEEFFKHVTQGRSPSHPDCVTCIKADPTTVYRPPSHVPQQNRAPDQPNMRIMLDL